MGDEVYSEKLEEKLEQYRETERLLKQGNVVEERIPAAHGILGGKAESVGIFYLLLGERVEANQWFKTATDHYLTKIDMVEKPPEPAYQSPALVKDALYLAILSTNDVLISEAVDRTVDIPDGYPSSNPTFASDFHYVKALAGYLLDDISNAEEHLRQIEPVDDPEIAIEGWRKGIKGLVGHDIDLIVEAMEHLLRHHENTKGQEPSTANEYTSLDVLVYIQLATSSGLEIIPSDLDDELRVFVPTAIFEGV